jgi:ferritin
MDKLKMIGTDKGGLYFFDRDLGSMSANPTEEKSYKSK